jgi:spoIIIJ-associated protein
VEWIEETGDTVEEALAAALEEAQLSEEEAEIEIVAKPLVGRLFGAKAKVRVRPKEGLPPEATAPAAARMAKEFLEGLVEAFGLNARVEARAEDGTVVAEIAGDGLGVLIGYHGSTLSAIEEVVRTVVARKMRSKVRVRVDVAGYREKRRTQLEEFARGLAEKAVREKTQITLKPMSAADRKVVHDAVKVVEGVKTYSEGEEPRRSVVIAPAEIGAAAGEPRQKNSD